MHFPWALFARGVGWNFLYSGGTTLLTEAYCPEERTKVQGAMDFWVFATMALTSFGSGALAYYQWRLELDEPGLAAAAGAFGRGAAVACRPSAGPAESAHHYRGMKMGLLDIVGGMLGDQPGGGGAGGGQDELLRLVMSLLADNGQGGGLAGLVEKFQSAGMAEQVNSWVGAGQNLPVSPEQLQGAFGADRMSQMAERMGLSTGDLGTQLSQMLPQAVDRLTPQGQLPEGGLGDLGSLLGSLLGSPMRR